MVVPHLRRFMQLNARRMLELEREIEDGRKMPEPKMQEPERWQLPGAGALRIVRDGKELGAWSFEELRGVVDDGNPDGLEKSLRENIEHYFGVPQQAQMLFRKDGPLLTATDFIELFLEPAPALYVFDKRDYPRGVADAGEDELWDSAAGEPGDVPSGLDPPRLPGVSPSDGTLRPPADAPRRSTRTLFVDCNGLRYDWVDLEQYTELLEVPNLEETLRQNVEHYFEVPYQRQLISDQYGPLTAEVDFRRVLENQHPYFMVEDCRSVLNVDRVRQPWCGQAALPRMAAPRPSLDRWLTADSASCNADAFAGIRPLGEDPAAPVGGRRRNERMSRSVTFSEDCINTLFDSSSVSSTGSPGSSVSFGDRVSLGSPTSSSGRSPSRTSWSVGSDGGSASAYQLVQVKLKKELDSHIFGFQVDPAANGRGLLITGIVPHGLLARWNREHPDSDLGTGDVVRSVNSVSDDPDGMLRKLVDSQEVVIRATRLPR